MRTSPVVRLTSLVEPFNRIGRAQSWVRFWADPIPAWPSIRRVGPPGETPRSSGSATGGRSTWVVLPINCLPRHQARRWGSLADLPPTCRLRVCCRRRARHHSRQPAATGATPTSPRDPATEAAHRAADRRDQEPAGEVTFATLATDSDRKVRSAPGQHVRPSDSAKGQALALCLRLSVAVCGCLQVPLSDPRNCSQNCRQIRKEEILGISHAGMAPSSMRPGPVPTLGRASSLLPPRFHAHADERTCPGAQIRSRP